MHLLSTPELAAVLLALYNPLVFDIHEQCMLCTKRRQHPLLGHPFADGMSLPCFRGTVVVADALGHLARHPKVYIPEIGEWVPYPYIGDLLLFLSDCKGPFCLNWNIKNKDEQFTRRNPVLFHKPTRDGPDPGVVARQEIERQYYLDAGIRTLEFSLEHFDVQVFQNLRELFGFHGLEIQIDRDDRNRIVQIFATAIGTDQPAIEVASQIEREFSISRDDAIALLKQGIWNREIPVDLYSRVLVDRPLRRMERDVLQEYAAWFVR